MKTDNQLKYLKILNQSLKVGKITKKDYKKEIKFVRTINKNK